MRKFIIVLAILTLVSGVAYAIDKDQAITNEYAARNIGRSITTDSSVIMKVWCEGGTAADYVGVGVSSSTSVIVYTNYMTGTGTTLGSSSTALDTVGEMVDHINAGYSTSSTVKIKAAVGADGYRSLATTTLVPANITVCGLTRADTTAQVLRQTHQRISAGVEDKEGVVNRIKSICGALVDCDQDITYRILDGGTEVWRKVVPYAVYRTSSHPNSSGNTVTFPDGKGISSTSGNGLVAEISTASATDEAVSAPYTTENQVSIVYDQLKQ